MTKGQQEISFNSFVEKMRTTMLMKGDDYANSDRLSNFKQVGSITGLNAKSAALTLIATKVARIGNLMNSTEEVKNEPLTDSILDLANYAILLNMIIEEEESNKVKTAKQSVGDIPFDIKKYISKEPDINLENPLSRNDNHSY